MRQKTYKYFIFFLASLLIIHLRPDIASAGPVDIERASRTAEAWLSLDSTPLDAPLGAIIQNIDAYRDSTGRPLYYIVYLEPAGFLIVSGDDLIEPVVGFVEGGEYVPSDDNPLGALVTRDLAGRVLAAREWEEYEASARTDGGKERAFRKAADKWAFLESMALSADMEAGLGTISDIRVSPLVSSVWSQENEGGSPCYNYYTVWESVYYPCGCVATAMAQLMRFHQWPATGPVVAQHAIKVDDVTQYETIRGGDGSGGAYNWSLMTLDPDAGTGLNSREAIGALTFDAGVSVSMKYFTSGSSSDTRSAADAFVAVFGYGNAIKGYNSGNNIPSSTLNDMVNPNLDGGLPALLGITGPPGGHAIVVDGYGYQVSTLYHHLNMGWGAGHPEENAWYNLPDIDSDPAFTSVYKVVYNVYTSGTGEIISGRITDSGGAPVGGASVTASRSGGGTYTTTSNSNGIYALKKIPSDSSYNIEVSKTGYSFTSQSISSGTSVNNSTTGNVWEVDFSGLSGCYPSISPTSRNHVYTASTDNEVAVTANAGCAWSSTDPSESWVTITSGAAGNGNGTLYYSVDEHTDYYNRTCGFTVAGRDFVVNQEARYLTSGEGVDASVEQSEEKVYKIGVYTGCLELKVKLDELSADLDLYTKYDSQPTTDNFDCRSAAGGTSSETCYHANPTPGTWYIMVRGYNAGSGTLTATTCHAPTVPYMITHASLDCDGNFQINWSPVFNASGYVLQRAANASFTDASTLYSGASTSYNQTDLGIGTYYFRVKATNSCGVSDWQAGAAITVSAAPSMPPGISYPTSDCDGNFQVSWTAVSGADSYTLQRSTNASFTDADDVYAGSSTSYNQSGLGDGAYYYRVRASNSCGESGWRSGSAVTVSSTPSAPSAISYPSENSGGDFTVNWSSVSGAADYTLQRSTDASFTDAGDVYSGSSTSYNQSGLGDGTYYYRVRASNSCGESGWRSGSAVTVSSIPSAPAAINYPTEDCGGDFTVSWSSVSEAADYTLQRSTNASFADPAEVYSGSSTSYNQSGLGDGTYYYRVRANNASGVSDWRGGSALAVSSAPSPPTAIAYPSIACDGDCEVSWPAVSGSDGYVLQRSTDASFATKAILYSGSSISYHQTGLGDGTYYYRVQAKNTCGESGWRTGSAVAIFSAPTPPASISYPNTDLDGNYTVSWATVEGADGYTLQRSEYSDFFGVINLYSGTADSYNQSGLSKGDYYYRVCSTNSCGNSAWRTGHVIQVEAVTPVARIDINHPDVAELVIYLGVGHPANPKIEKEALSSGTEYAGHFVFNVYLDSLAAYLPPDRQNIWYVKIVDSVSGNQGIINSFSILYDKTYQSDNVPVLITDFKPSFAFIGGRGMVNVSPAISILLSD